MNFLPVCTSQHPVCTTQPPVCTSQVDEKGLRKSPYSHLSCSGERWQPGWAEGGNASRVEGSLALGIVRHGGFLESEFRAKTATNHCQPLILLKGGWLWGHEEAWGGDISYIWHTPNHEDWRRKTAIWPHLLWPSPPEAKPLWFGWSQPCWCCSGWCTVKGLGVAKPVVVLVWKRHPECEEKSCFGISLSFQLSRWSQLLYSAILRLSFGWGDKNDTLSSPSSS